MGSLALEAKNHRQNSHHVNSHAPLSIGELIKEKEKKKQLYYSFELISRAKDDNIYKRFFKEVQCDHQPLFFALSWHGNTNKDFLSLKILSQFPRNTLFHLIARGMRKNDVERILNRALELGMMNLLVLRGDNLASNGDFIYASDLIEFIKEKYGDKFCIGVAGYPNTHPESPSKDLDLYYLKKKVDAGASFILSQILFESEPFLQFIKDCRKYGINVPVIPGIIPITNYDILLKFQQICKLDVPEKIHQDFNRIKEDQQKVEKYGLDLATNIATEILSSKLVYGFHLFTRNELTIADNVCKSIFSRMKLQYGELEK